MFPVILTWTPCRFEFIIILYNTKLFIAGRCGAVTRCPYDTITRPVIRLLPLLYTHHAYSPVGPTLKIRSRDGPFFYVWLIFFSPRRQIIRTSTRNRRIYLIWNTRTGLIRNYRKYMCVRIIFIYIRANLNTHIYTCVPVIHVNWRQFFKSSTHNHVSFRRDNLLPCIRYENKIRTTRSEKRELMMTFNSGQFIIFPNPYVLETRWGKYFTRFTIPSFITRFIFHENCYSRQLWTCSGFFNSIHFIDQSVYKLYVLIFFFGS